MGLDTTQPANLVNTGAPILAANSSLGEEDTQRIPGSLYFIETGVVCTEKRLLPIGLVDIRLVGVRTRTGGNGAPFAHNAVRKFFLQLAKCSSITNGSVPRGREGDGVEQRVTPRRVDSVVGVSSSSEGRGDIEPEEEAFRNIATEHVEEFVKGGGVVPDAAREETRSRLRGPYPHDLFREAGLPSVVKSGICSRLGLKRDTEFLGFGVDWGKKVVDFLDAHVGSEYGKHGESLSTGDCIREYVEVGINTHIGMGLEQQEVFPDDCPEIVVGEVAISILCDIGTRGREIPNRNSDGEIRESLDGDRDNDTESRSTSTAESPENI